MRCSLRPEARHPAYTLSVTCSPSASLGGMRRALRRLSFFQNPARYLVFLPPAPWPRVAHCSAVSLLPLLPCTLASARLRAITHCTRNRACCQPRLQRRARHTSSPTGNCARRRTGSSPWTRVRACCWQTFLLAALGCSAHLAFMPCCPPLPCLRPTNHHHHHCAARKGVEHQRAGRLKEALKAYNMALSINRNNVEALTARGALHTKLCVNTGCDSPAFGAGGAMLTPLTPQGGLQCSGKGSAKGAAAGPGARQRNALP